MRVILSGNNRSTKQALRDFTGLPKYDAGVLLVVTLEVCSNSSMPEAPTTSEAGRQGTQDLARVAQEIAMPARPDLPESLRIVALTPTKQPIDKVRYSHEAMADQILANPWVSQNELAKVFGYTAGWVSQVIASDAFQSYLAERKEQIVDPVLRASIEDRFKALVTKSTEVLLERLSERGADGELALGVLSAASKALGYGARGPQVQVNTQYVVQVPPKEATSAEWVTNHNPARQAAKGLERPLVIEQEPQDGEANS